MKMNKHHQAQRQTISNLKFRPVEKEKKRCPVTRYTLIRQAPHDTILILGCREMFISNPTPTNTIYRRWPKPASEGVRRLPFRHG